MVCALMKGGQRLMARVACAAVAWPAGLILGGCHIISGYSNLELREDPEPVFSKSFGDEASQITRDLTVDASGNVLLVGDFEGGIDFGGEPMVSAGERDFFVTKLGPGGEHLWSRSYGGSATEQALAVTLVDEEVVVAGTFTDELVLEDTTLSNSGPSGTESIFIARFKLDSGDFSTAQSHGNEGLELLGQRVRLTTDPDGALIAAGGYSGRLDFGCGPFDSLDTLDIFISRWEGESCDWTQRLGDASWQTVESVGVDLGQNVIVAGEFAGNIDFGDTVLTSSGGIDIFVAKLSSDGTHQWSRRFGNNVGMQGAAAVAVHLLGNVAVAGLFEGTVDFGGGPLSSQSGHDIFVVKLDPSGIHLWSKSFHVTRDRCDPLDCQLSGIDLAVDGAGNLVLAGFFRDQVDFGGTVLQSAGAEDMFLAKLDVEGDLLWSGSFGDAAAQCEIEDCTISVAADRGLNTLLSGYLLGTADFGNGPLVSEGDRDVFVAKFGP